MTAPTRADSLSCPNCVCACAPQQRELAAAVRRRHEQAVHRAAHHPPARALPAAPSHAHWLVGPRWTVAHLVDATGRSLCRKVNTGRDTQPAPATAKPCRPCLETAGIDE